MKQVPEIRIVAYHKGSRKVTYKDEANFVKLEVRTGKERELLILHKKSYNNWDKLPMIV